MISNLQKVNLKVIVRFNTEKFIDPSGELFFDLVNTVVIKGGQEADLLESTGDIFAWAVSAGIVDEAGAAKVMRLSGADADEFFERALLFRNALRNIALDLIDGTPVSGGAVQQINKYLKLPFGYQQLNIEGANANMQFEASFSTPESLLAPVAANAARILTEGDPSKVKQCESGQCVLFFYDSTKNHSRRWCSMESCGNREKVKAFYKRKRKGKK